MSSGSTIMLSTASSAAAGDDDEYNNVKCRACYGVVVAGVSLLLFCALAVTAGLVQACAVSGFAMMFFGVIGWLVPPEASTRGGRRGLAHGEVTMPCQLVGATTEIDMPPAFAYECPADDAAEGAGGKAGAGTALCAVCLEGVRRGEAVRRLRACGHLFHRECVDMWLRSHATCPLCRHNLVPRAWAAKRTVTTAAAAARTVGDVLPPV
ncbi:unnamed protein product [Urochloa decumbens]|uniref:RING-type E3 ubiquitin transferase n=1 Tax=Urochloa decumbens TaxID=240449 RepID=A0ABC8VE06_9POAL